MGWHCLAAPSGGTVAALADDRRTSVFAATPVGVFRSCDVGTTWTLLGASRVVPFAEALHAGDPAGILVGARDGLYRSSDGGETWQRLLTGGAILGVASAPGGLVVVATEHDGVLRSEDEGRSWSGANAGLLDLTALTVALSPCFDEDRLGFVGTASGLYRTRNGARSWRAVETGLEEEAVQCVAVSPGFAEDRLVVAGTESAGLLRSDDGGSTWQHVLAGSVTAVAFSERNVVAATDAGIAVSHDGAQTWHMVGAPPGDVLSLASVGNSLLAGLHRLGVARSTDGGATWRSANEGLTARVKTSLAVAPDGSLFEASIEDGIRVSRDRGTTWQVSWLADSVVLGLAISPTYVDDRTIYVATSAGIHVSRDGGITWRLCDVSGGHTRMVATAPSGVFAALGDGSLLATDDGAGSWRTLPSPGGGEVVAIAHVDARTLFVAMKAAAEVTLWRSVDNGQSWHRWLVESGTDLLPLAISPAYSIDETIFVGSGSRVLKPRRQSRERRGGESRPLWHAAELAGAAAVTALAVSPYFTTDRTIVAGTNAGVFISRTSGDTFTPWSDGLHPRAVVAVAFAPDSSVYALGLGGGVWRRRLTDE